MMRHLCSIMLGIGTLCGWLLVTPGWVSFYRNQWVLYFTMLCLGFGSVPLFITNNQLGYLFPKKYESIITYNNGMFDMGDGVTLIPKLLHQKFGLGLNFWFFCFFIAVIYVTIRTVVFMPKMFVGKDDFSEKAIDEEKVELKATIDLAANSEISETVVQTSKSKKEAAEPAELPPVSTKQIFQWFRMPEFFCLVPFLTFYVTNLSFFHQALNAWLMEISGGDDYFVSWMTDIFAYLQPMALVFSQTGGFLIGQVQNIYKRKNTTLPDSQKFTGMNIKRKGIVFYMFTVMTSILVTNVLLAIASMTNLYRNTPFMVVLFLFEVWGRTSFFSILDIFFLTEFPVNAYGRVLGVSQFLWAAIAPINQILLKVAQNTRDWDFFLKGYPLVMFFYFCCVMATGLYGMWRYNRATIEYSDLIFVTKESENGRE